MCGIAGAIFGSRPVTGEVLGQRFVRALGHRGPDGHGIELLADGAGVLAHTRLSIIDLSERASQPFKSDDGRCVLVFNGEIYNFRELRGRLESRGATFRSSSDTEVILRQYLDAGAEGLDQIHGMFALAIWDARDRSVTLMRDRLGKKPLYWARAKDGTFLFGSEIKALLCHDELSAELAVERLPEYLTYGYVTTPHSLYAGINKLPPAHRLIFQLSSGTARAERYWALRPQAHPSSSIDDAKREVRSQVAAAVRRRLISDVPLGAFLSGGIDSSIVVAEMARASTDRVRTFTVGFSADPSFDERDPARIVSKLFGTDHTEIVLDDLPRDQLPQLLCFHDEPYGDSSALAVYAVSAATRKHVKVVLTGDGGDEVFAGYTRFRGGLVTGIVPQSLARLLHAAAEVVPEPRSYKNPLALARRFLQYAERSRDEQLLAFNSFFAGSRLSALLRPEVFGASFDPWAVLKRQTQILEEARAQGSDRLDQILRHNLATYLVDDLLVKADRMTMATGLEARSPFLDTELVERVFELPSALKLRMGQLKWLLRAAYRDVLPASILDRRKHGFGVPLSRWWNNEMAGIVDDLLLSPSARARELLRGEEIERLVREHRSSTRDHGQRIFALLQLELWLRASLRPTLRET